MISQHAVKRVNKKLKNNDRSWNHVDDTEIACEHFFFINDTCYPFKIMYMNKSLLISADERSGLSGMPQGIAWHHVKHYHIVKYQTVMDEMLELIDVNNNNALHCTDQLCSDVNHRSYIDNL